MRTKMEKCTMERRPKNKYKRNGKKATRATNSITSTEEG
jgi:hypothetical protein